MKCPQCQVDNDRVIDTRASEDRTTIRQRWECLTCGRRYTTHERYEPAVLRVIKKDGVREPFEREKIRRGLEKACWNRPISHDQIETVVNAVESEAAEPFDVEVDAIRWARLSWLTFASWTRSLTCVLPASTTGSV